MSTHIYPSPVFGPIHSRRLGISLGINLLPPDGKVCSFDCVYCECGLNAERRPHKPFPTIHELHTALRHTLQQMTRQGQQPDVLTFAGNGEPTLHPHFAEAIDCVIGLRNEFCPAAKVSVLSNATQIHLPQVRQALMRVDNNILKLDTADAAYIRRANCPRPGYDVERTIELMAEFGGHVIIQTMMMQGQAAGQSYDNTPAALWPPYLQALQRIRPSQVMLYTLDRDTPLQGLLKATPTQLQALATQIRALGIDTTVSY